MDNNRGQVLIAAPVHPVLTDWLTAMGYQCHVQVKIKPGEEAALVAPCVGIITSTRLQLDAALLDAAPHLQWIGRMGSGMEVIDLAHTASRGIACVSSPEGNCNAVGEHALGMLLSLIRRIPLARAQMEAGQWLRDENRGTELEGRTMGIIGFGHTGRSFARKLTGFDMKVLAYDKFPQTDVPDHVTLVDKLDAIYKEADFVSFHVPLGHDTTHYFNKTFIDRMAKPFVLINTSRGPVVDTAALYAALTNGKVIGACLDVWEQEPVPAKDPFLNQLFSELITYPNVISTPHIAGYTFEALYKMSRVLKEKLSGVI